jgi:tetratricopeptide (TPR) repeat protein
VEGDFIKMKTRVSVFFNIAILLVVISVGYMTWAVLLPRYANKKYRESSELRERGCFHGALNSINIAIFLKPTTSSYYTDRALVYWLLAKSNPADTNFVYMSKMNWNKALELERNNNLHQNFGNMYYGLALAEHKLGEIDQGIADYQKAYDYTSDPARKSSIASILGYIYFDSKKYLVAVDWLDKVSEDDPVYFDSCIRNALSNHRLNNFKRAEDLYLKALAVQPDDGNLNIYIAHLYAELGEPNKVIGYLKCGLERLRDVGLVFATLGNDNFTSEPWSSAEFLKLYDCFFDHFQKELQSYVAGNFSEDTLEMKKLNAFYRSVNKVVVHSLDNPNPEVSDYAQALLAKIKEAGLFREGVAQEKGERLKQPRFDGHSERNHSVPEGESNEPKTAQDLQPGV